MAANRLETFLNLPAKISEHFIFLVFLPGQSVVTSMILCGNRSTVATGQIGNVRTWRDEPPNAIALELQ